MSSPPPAMSKAAPVAVRQRQSGHDGQGLGGPMGIGLLIRRFRVQIPRGALETLVRTLQAVSLRHGRCFTPDTPIDTPNRLA